MKPSNMIALIDRAKRSVNWVEGLRTLECQELARAIVAQDWGQNGSVFITDRSHWPAGPGHTRRLYVNSRLRAVASYDRGISDARLETVHSPEQGEQEYFNRKVEARRDEERRQAARRRCVCDLITAGVDWVARCTGRAARDWRYYCPTFRGWRYEDGANGGTFSRDGDTVAADGALKAARSAQTPHEIEEIFWNRVLYGARF